MACGDLFDWCDFSVNPCHFLNSVGTFSWLADLFDCLLYKMYTKHQCLCTLNTGLKCTVNTGVNTNFEITQWGMCMIDGRGMSHEGCPSTQQTLWQKIVSTFDEIYHDIDINRVNKRDSSHINSTQTDTSSYFIRISVRIVIYFWRSNNEGFGRTRT
jgi:hypothetical protein